MPDAAPRKVTIKAVNPNYHTYECNADQAHIVRRVVLAAKTM